MQVRDLISSRVSLAPMAGITDYVLRSLVREYSKTCLLTTEMISSEALTQVKDTDIVARDENHSPISYQLSGHKPKMIAECANYLQKYADMIDINMGCPVNKVVKGTDGCALMRNVDLAQEIVRTVKAVISLQFMVVPVRRCMEAKLIGKKLQNLSVMLIFQFLQTVMLYR